MIQEQAMLAAELMQHVPVGVVVWELTDPADDRSLRLIYANPASVEVLRADVTGQVGRSVFEVFPNADPERVKRCAEVCRDRTRRDLGRTVLRRDEGEPPRVATTAVPVLDRCVAVIYENMSELDRAETEALRVHRFLDSILEHLPAMVFVKDARTLKFERFNRAGEELLGLPREKLIGRSDYDFFPKEQADFFVTKDREVLARGTLEDIPEEPIQTPSGTRWLHTRKIPILDAQGSPQYLLGVSVDITEKREAQEVLRASHEELERRFVQQMGERERAELALARTEEQLRQAQKMEAIGLLAGGIAHDFNNILSIVLGYCESILDRMKPTDALFTEISEIRAAGERAAGLTRQLLAFSRQQVLQPQVIDLDDVVSRMTGMFQRVVGEDVQVEVCRGGGLARVEADPGQIEQVILNLVINARDAMPTGGKLVIETRNVILDEAYVDSHLGCKTGPYVMLAVSDSGTGMDRGTAARVFEPFFTTKERGKGSGLGLSTALGIVQQSGGTIWVYSEPERGTTFKVLLPATSAAATAPEVAPEVAGGLTGTETVLLVEDNDQVRDLTARLLRKFGYTVIPSRSGADALERLAGARGPVHLLLTDVVMPDMSGPALAKRVARKRPGTRVLYMSGYTDDAIVRHGMIEAQADYLQKPFRAEDLGRLVRETLDRPTADGNG